MIKKIIIIISVFVGLYYFRQWFLCVNFADPVHFSAYDMSLKLIEAVHNDVGFAPNVTRIFHNKVSLGAILISNNYLHFWDVRFATLLFSPVMYFGIWLGFWYLAKSKIKHKWIILTAILALPFIEVFKINLHYFFRLVLIVAPLFVFSIYGLWNFVRKENWKRNVLLIALIIFSLWYMSVFGSDIFLNCFKGV